MRKPCWGSHHICPPELCLSVGKGSQLFFAQTPGQAFLGHMGLPLWRRPHGSIACEDQISCEILLQRLAQAKLALQRGFQPGMPAAGAQLGVGSGIMSREGGKDSGQVWEQRRQLEKLLQGMRKARGGGLGEPGLPWDECRVELVYVFVPTSTFILNCPR